MAAFRPRRPHAFALGLVAGVVLVPGVALAGSGVGAVFNLGKTNTVNSPTTLTGSTSGRMLQVSNTGTGSALRLSTRAGVPPMQVTSTGKVANLNADLLDGVDSTAFVRGDGASVEQVLHARLTAAWNSSQTLLTVPALGSLEATCSLSPAGQPGYQLVWRTSAASEAVFAIDSLNNNAAVQQLASPGDALTAADASNGFSRIVTVSAALPSGATANLTVQAAVFTTGSGGCVFAAVSVSG